MYLFTGGRFLDPRQDSLQDGIELLVEHGLVREVSDRPIKSAAAHRIDLKGRTLMPGLIDAHIHIVLTEVNLQLLSDVPLTLLAAKGSTAMRAMLMRGFTTLRDTGGADYGMKEAVAQGHFLGPRLFIAGQPLSQTGGHADHRKRTQTSFSCACCHGLAFSARVADGVPDVIKAVRDELRKGADHIKIMASGGVASQADPLESLQYRMDEIEAAVEEATRWGSYVCAHAYTAKAIDRAVRGGVRTIEHGNLIDAPTAALMAERGAYIVPTLVAYDALKRRGTEYGLTEYSLAKNDMVLQGGLRSLEICQQAGVKIGFGSDLLGQLQNDHCNEFTIRGEVMRPQDVIRSATLVNAEIVRQEGKLGELIPGAHADLLVVDGDPTTDLSVFLGDGARIPAIMLAGRFVKNTNELIPLARLPVSPAKYPQHLEIARMSVALKQPRPDMTDAEWQTRCDLAALYRVVDHLGWTDLVNTHMSARIPGEPNTFLINNYGEMFDEITASSLVKMDLDGNVIGGQGKFNSAGFTIHSGVYKGSPNANCIMHTHTRAGAGLSLLQNGLRPMSQDALEILDDVTYHAYGLPASAEECEELARNCQKGSCIVLLNHGLLTHAPTIQGALYRMYCMERAAELEVMARCMGAEPVEISPHIIQKAAERMRRLRDKPEFGLMEWQGLVRTVDRKGADYRR